MRTAILPLLVLISLLSAACNRSAQADVGFAQKTFQALAQGDETVAADIDWKVLQSMGIDVGLAYVVLASDEERARFREGFITQFASAFKNSGSKAEDFTHWRAASHGDMDTVVKADGPGGTLTITVSHREDKQQLSSIQKNQP
jgi:hypothetical protein